MAKQYIDTTRYGKFYYKDPEMTILHRTDGPAYEYSDDSGEAWWVNGKRHRLDGPAYEYANGDKEWWVNGVYLFTVSVGTEDKIVDRMKY